MTSPKPQDRNTSPSITPTALRSARSVSLASVAWTALVSTLAMIAGLAAGSLTLIAFALAGTLDAAGSAVLADHFDRDLRVSRRSRQSERLALRVISIGMFAVGVSTAVVSLWRLARGSETTSTPAGPVIAGASLVGLSVLAHRKTVIGDRVGSAGLMADAQLSRFGIALAAVSLVGTGVDHVWHWSRLDPAAALVIALVALAVARIIAQDARRS